MKLSVLSKEDCEKVRIWRNQSLETLRTPYQLTKEMQEVFYRDVICNPNSPHRYWAIRSKDNILLGMVGLTDISDGLTGEISLIIHPGHRRLGVASESFKRVLDKGFKELSLQIVYGEAYMSNMSGVNFWVKVAMQYNAKTAILPDRKRWQGRFWDSFYFSIKNKDVYGK